MITMTRPRSRPAESPCSRIDAEATALATQAEIALLRRLLLRADSYLSAVVQEARLEGQPDCSACSGVIVSVGGNAKTLALISSQSLRSTEAGRGTLAAWRS